MDELFDFNLQKNKDEIIKIVYEAGEFMETTHKKPKNENTIGI